MRSCQARPECAPAVITLSFGRAPAWGVAGADLGARGPAQDQVVMFETVSLYWGSPLRDFQAGSWPKLDQPFFMASSFSKLSM
jgi:hypothetical protein